MSTGGQIKSVNPILFSEGFEDKLTWGLWPEKRRSIFSETMPGSLIVKTALRDGDAGYFQVIV